MTELHAGRPDGKRTHPGSLIAYLAIGLLQGLALWMLARTENSPAFSGHAALRSGLVHFAAAAPIVWYLLADSPLTARARAIVALAIGVLLSGLAAHAAATSGDGREPFSFMLAAAVLLYMLVVLAAGFDSASRWFFYPRLFEHGWRNVLLLGAAGALTGILWVLLWGAALLLGALGVDALSTFLKQPVVVATLSCCGFSFFILQATLRDDALVTLRKFWLTLNSWFLPLALLLSITWVVALLVIGPQPLFQTRRAALTLFWFAALTVLFMNAAYQDGRTPTYGKWVATFTAWAWLSVPVLASVGIWALAVRVMQHGWSVDRLWAMVVGAMALIYGFGYSVSVFARSRWMPSLETTNIVASLSLVVAILLFTSPVADLRRIAVDSQLARLRSGQTTVAAIDLAALRREGGAWGRAALAQLAADPSLAEKLRADARLELAGKDRMAQEQDPEVALSTLRKEVRTLPSGAVPDPDLLALLSRTKADWTERMCLQSAGHCAVWLTDLDEDGKDEAVLLYEHDNVVQATVYVKGSGNWAREGQLQGPPRPMSEWFRDIEAKAVSKVRPRWRDVELGSRKYIFRTN
jgi:hypothetical protein